MTHYHVCQNLPGCLPESDPIVVATLAEANDLADEIEHEDDFGESGYIVDIIPCDESRPECLTVCPFVTADECATARERSVAGASDTIPSCSVHSAEHSA